MKKFKLIIFLIFLSCLSVSFASEDSNLTDSGTVNHVSELSDNTHEIVKTDFSVKSASNSYDKGIKSKKVTKNSTKTSINHTYARPNSYVFLNATVTTNNNQKVSTGKVLFKINGKTIKDSKNKTRTVNVKNGFAQLKYYTGLLTAKNYNLTVKYNGSAKYGVSMANNVLTVNKNRITINVSVNPSEVVTGKKMKLTAILTRNDNVTVNGGKVAFKLNHKTIKNKNGKPVYARLVNGKASIVTYMPLGATAKKYRITVTYSGTIENEETKSEDYRFNVLRDTPKIVLSKKTYTAEMGDKLNINGQILTSDNKNTNRNHKLAVKINGNTIFKYLIDANKFDFNLDTAGFKNSQYNLTIVIGENGAYHESRLETKIFVTHYYDNYFYIDDIVHRNDKHILLNIDNRSYEIKNLTINQPSKTVINGTKVVVENNAVKVRFNDTRKHEVYIDYYDDIFDLSNVTLNNYDDDTTIYTEYLFLFFDNNMKRIINLATSIEEDSSTWFIGDSFYAGYEIPEFSIILRIDHKVLKFSYNDNKTHNITIYKVYWEEPIEIDIDAPDFDSNYTETKVLEFTGSKSS